MDHDQRNRGNDHHNYDNHHHHQQHLGVNKMGKNIRKDPSNQQNLQQQQNPQALVYNINKTDFRSIVQQLTGLGSTSSVNPPQPTPPKPPNSRLVKVRPAPLTQLNHPPVQSVPVASEPVQSVNPAESPISAYMRYLIESSPTVGNQPQPQNQNPVQSSTGLFPSQQTGPNPMQPFQSPASQFVLSPQPRSPFPLFSPNFAFSPRFSGGSESLPPPSPGFFFPLLSPLWKNQ
ncbi:protein HAIKU1 [Capsella rubella]|nr:protein HAIKU1 [Capsella rubella]